MEQFPRLTLAGYQGPRSVHTRALDIMRRELAAQGFSAEFVGDVTAAGRSAASLFADLGREPCLVGYMASGYLTSRVPDLALFDLPFPQTDRDRAFGLLDGAVGDRLSRAVAAQAGRRVLGFWDNGLRHVSSRVGPIRSPEDCRGLVIRTLDNRIYQDMLAALGFVPRVTDVRELVTAVASGAVDAQENPLTNVVGFGLQAHHRFVTLTGHIAGMALLVCSEAWHRTLTPAAAQALEAAARVATAAQRRFAAEEDLAARADLLAAGVVLHSPTTAERSALAQNAAAVAASVRRELDPDLLAAWE